MQGSLWHVIVDCFQVLLWVMKPAQSYVGFPIRESKFNHSAGMCWEEGWCEQPGVWPLDFQLLVPKAETIKVAEPELCSQLARGAVGSLPCSVGDAGAAWWGGLSEAPFTSNAQQVSCERCRIAHTIAIIFLRGLAHLAHRLC